MNIKLSNRIRVELSNKVSHDGKLEIEAINIDNIKYAIGYTANKMQDFRRYIEQRISIQLDNELSNYFESNKNTNIKTENNYNNRFYSIPKTPSKAIEDVNINISYEKILEGIIIVYDWNKSNYDTKSHIEYDLINGGFNRPLIYTLIPNNDLRNMLIMYQYDIGTVPEDYKELIQILKWFQNKKSVWIIKTDGTKSKLEDLYTMALSRYDLTKVDGFKYKREMFYISGEPLQNLLNTY